MNLSRRAVTSGLAALAVVGPGATAARAEGALDDGILRYLIGSKPGGGYDQYGRLVAKYLQAQLTGVTVVPENRGTAGGVPALRAVVEAPADAPLLMIFNTGLLMSQLGGLDSLDFDLGALRWVGKAASEARVLLVHPKTGIESFADLVASKKRLIFLTADYGSAAFVQMHLVQITSKLDVKILAGFGGSESEAALMKGEADGLFVSESNVAPLVAAGAARPIAYYGKPSTSVLDGVPDGQDLVQSADEKLVAEAIAALSLLGRPTVVSPAIAEADLARLRAAYAAAMADPALLAEAATLGLSIDPMPGDAAEAMAQRLLRGDPRLKELVAQALADR